MSYIGKSPTGTGVRSRYYYTATGGETSISGADDSGAILTFTDGAYVDVYLNGVLLVAGTDYNTSTANTISSLAALAGSDIVEVLVYDIFTVADTVKASSGGTFNGGVTVNGTLTATGQSNTASILPSADATSVIGGASNRYTDLYLSGGVYLGGTGSDNKLDDYEEGTFTPSIGTTYGWTKGTISGAEGYYTKVGDIVNCYVTFDAAGSVETVVENDIFAVTGLPFTAKDLSDSPVKGQLGTLHIYDSIGSQRNAAGLVSIGGTDDVWCVVTFVAGVVDYNNDIFLTFSYKVL